MAFYNVTKVKDIYSESIQIQIAASSMLSENITNATQMVMQCLLGGNKVIACGVSRSYANAQFLVSNLLNRYDLVRPSFPSVLLSLESAVGSSLVLNNRLKNCIVINLMPLQNRATYLLLLHLWGQKKSC